MNTIKLFLLLIGCFLTITSCSEDESESPDDGLCVYYTHDDYFGKEFDIFEKDTILLTLGDSISIYIRTTERDGTTANIESTDLVDVAKINNNEFTLYAKETGVTLASAICGQEYVLFYIKIKPYGERFYIKGESTYVIDVANDDLRNNIKEEIELIYSPKFADSFGFIYTTSENGRAELINYFPYPKDTITGSFVVTEGKKIEVVFPDAEYTFKITKSESNSASYLRQDLTGTFRERYPFEQIDEVTITSLAENVAMYFF